MRTPGRDTWRWSPAAESASCGQSSSRPIKRCHTVQSKLLTPSVGCGVVAPRGLGCTRTCTRCAPALRRGKPQGCVPARAAPARIENARRHGRGFGLSQASAACVRAKRRSRCKQRRAPRQRGAYMWDHEGGSELAWEREARRMVLESKTIAPTRRDDRAAQPYRRSRRLVDGCAPDTKIQARRGRASMALTKEAGRAPPWVRARVARPSHRASAPAVAARARDPTKSTARVADGVRRLQNADCKPRVAPCILE